MKTPHITLAILQTLKKWNTDPYLINSGNCDSFAQDVCDKVNDAEMIWSDIHARLIPSKIENDVGSHCFIRYHRKYYDAECPQGVNHPLQLPFYNRA